jgi:ligand-binding sensor domain-containing protein
MMAKSILHICKKLHTIVFLTSLTFSQNNTSFEKFSTELGLSQNSIVRILQDSRGFLWLCTFDGLNRYDGYQFKIFKNIPGDSTSLSNNKILSICEDNSGNIWIGTYGGRLNKLQLQNNFVEQILLSSEYNNIRDEECYNIKKIIYQLTHL